MELAETTTAKIKFYESGLVEGAFILEREYTSDNVMNRKKGEKEQFMIDEEDLRKIANRMGFDIVKK